MNVKLELSINRDLECLVAYFCSLLFRGGGIWRIRGSDVGCLMNNAYAIRYRRFSALWSNRSAIRSVLRHWHRHNLRTMYSRRG